MMRRDAGTFAIGFALGALSLGLVLWGTGALRVGPQTVSTQQPQPAAVPQGTSQGTNLEAPPPKLSDFSNPPAPHQEPMALPPSTPAGEADRSTGSADRSIPTTGKLMVPVAGVNVNQLVDTFHDKRSGHMHEALDIPAPRGTQVLAAVEGNVAKLFNSRDGGLTVYQFDNNGVYCYYYAHLDRYAPNLKEGMLLRKGDVVGYVGTTGDAPPNAPHLHFAVFKLGPEKKWWKGTALDPLPMLKGE